MQAEQYQEAIIKDWKNTQGFFMKKCVTEKAMLKKSPTTPDSQLRILKKIKEHMFYNEYELGRKNPSRFDPDYDQALSWQRLTDGKDIQEMDIVMLKHELTEQRLMVEEKMSYREAHDITELKYNYSKYIKDLNRKEGLF